MICRDRDTDTESNGLETRDYILQNWRADVIALANASGNLLERVWYDPYGVPFATHPTDLTKGAIGSTVGYGMPDGVLNNDDYSYFLTLYSGSDWRADWNRDGTINATDNTVYLADKAAASGSWGRGVLSNKGNVLGYAGYVHEPATGGAGGGHGTMWHVRHRVLHSGLGRWVQRLPLRHAGPISLIAYGRGDPVRSAESPLTLTGPFPTTADSLGHFASTLESMKYSATMLGDRGVCAGADTAGPPSLPVWEGNCNLRLWESQYNVSDPDGNVLREIMTCRYRVRFYCITGPLPGAHNCCGGAIQQYVPGGSWPKPTIEELMIGLEACLLLNSPNCVPVNPMFLGCDIQLLPY